LDAPGTAASLLSRCCFPPAGTAVDCAVSGGPDSLALLALARKAGCRVTAWHVDHGLRPGSADEADVVRAACGRFGAAFHAVTVDVTRGPNLEARARAARYAALPDGVLTGHTADDVAETVVLNLLRGAGIDGLTGIRDSGRRPLLALRRSETAAVCRAFGLDPVHDPTNDDLHLRRNRVRHEVLPLLADVAERDVVSVLARQAVVLAADAALLDRLAASVDPTDARALAACEPALGRRAVRNWLRAGSDDEHHPPDLATVERVLAVARGDAAATDIGGGRRIVRSAGRLRLEERG
jgi:tRNA(Ile)-lysidine synthase